MGLERVVEESPIPHTILRATQFYDLILMALRALERLPVPEGFLGQPIDAGEVAKRPVGLALSEPTGRVRVVGGPEVRTLDDAVRLTSRSRAADAGYCLSRSQARRRAIREDALTCPDEAYGELRWEEFLRSRVTSETSRLRFRRYWRMIRSSSAAIRRRWLRAARRRAERSAEAPFSAPVRDTGSLGGGPS